MSQGLGVQLGLGGGKSATSGGAPGGGGGGRAPFIPNTRSVLFDGANDFFKLASTIPFTGAFTFSCWVKPAGTAEGFIASGETGSSGPNITWLPPATWSAAYVTNMGTIYSGGNTIQAGTWYNLVLIRDGSNLLTLYRNGSALGATPTFSGTVDFQWFGARRLNDTTGSTFLNGHLDEIALWDSDRTSNLAAIYNSGVAGDLWEVSPPLHWYRMGDINSGSGVTIADIGSAADNDGTLVNGPAVTTDVPS